MSRKNISSLLNKLVVRDNSQRLQDKLYHLKHSLSEEKKFFDARSLRIEEILSNQLAKGLSMSQVRRLQAIGAEAGSFVQQFHALEQKFERARKGVEENKQCFINSTRYDGINATVSSSRNL